MATQIFLEFSYQCQQTSIFFFKVGWNDQLGFCSRFVREPRQINIDLIEIEMKETGQTTRISHATRTWPCVSIWLWCLKVVENSPHQYWEDALFARSMVQRKPCRCNIMEHVHIHCGVAGHSSKSPIGSQEFHQQNGHPENHPGAVIVTDAPVSVLDFRLTEAQLAIALPAICTSTSEAVGSSRWRTWTAGVFSLRNARPIDMSGLKHMSLGNQYQKNSKEFKSGIAISCNLNASAMLVSLFRRLFITKSSLPFSNIPHKSVSQSFSWNSPSFWIRFPPGAPGVCSVKTWGETSGDMVTRSLGHYILLNHLIWKALKTVRRP